MKTILVVANETVGGRPLLEKVRELAGAGDVHFVLCIPRNKPRHGAVIYDDMVEDAARIRLDLARQFASNEGIDMVGDIGDEDPFNATMDAIAEYRPDQVLISTFPVTQSGWLRRDLVDRVRDASGLPVEHVIVDVDKLGLPFDVTLVVGNQTIGEAGLLEHLKRKVAEKPEHLFVVVLPQTEGTGGGARQARERLAKTLETFREAGLLCAGMIGDPDPFTAAKNAVQYFHISDIVVSTLPATRSGWLRRDLVERLRSSTGKPVEHVVPSEQPAGARAAG
jgi:hypothetical protein